MRFIKRRNDIVNADSRRLHAPLDSKHLTGHADLRGFIVGNIRENLHGNPRKSALKWWLIIFFIARPIYAADDELISYLKDVGQITTDVQIIMRNVGLNPLAVDSGILELEENLQRFFGLNASVEVRGYHRLMLLGIESFRVTLLFISKKDIISSRRELRLGRLWFKKAASGFRKIAQEKGFIQEVKRDEATK